MNKRNLLIPLIALLLSGCAREFDIADTDVPEIVRSSFKQKYPSAEISGWEVEKSDGRLVFEAEFKLNGKKLEAEFRSDGTFVKEEND